jgi:hypothetical protein
LSIEQAWQIAEFLYYNAILASEAYRSATSMLTSLLRRPDLSIEQIRQTAESIYRRGDWDAQQLATSLLQRPELSIEQTWQIAQFLYSRSSEGSAARQLATSMLTSLLERPDLSIEQAWQTAEFLYGRSSEGSEAKLFATSKLLALLSRANTNDNLGDVYGILRRMVPQFHKLSLIEAHSKSNPRPSSE